MQKEEDKAHYKSFCSRLTNELIYDLVDNPFHFVNTAIIVARRLQRDENFKFEKSVVYNFSERVLREIIRHPSVLEDIDSEIEKTVE